MSKGISVFIPVYNSSSFIEDSLHNIYQYLSEHFDLFELVIVDDNSSDDTASIIQLFAQKNLYVNIFSNTNGPSRRENLGKAMNHARFEITIYFDADISVPLKHVLPAYKKIYEDGFDITIGSRYKGIHAVRSLERLMYSKIFNHFLRLFFNSKIHDHICGFKIFKTKYYRNLYAEIGYDQTYTRGWFWDAELLITAQKYKYRVYEMPVEWFAAKESTFNLRRESKMIAYILKKYRKLIKSPVSVSP